MDNRIEKVIAALGRNNMTGIYVPSKSDAVKAVQEMLHEGCTITAGGSMSLKESGVWELISRPEYRFYNRSRSGITPDEQMKAYQAAIGCDFFFCSSNAVTENGELINVDGNCNRISAISFGPKNVVMIVGVNKIVPDLEAGFLRVKQIAAPKNCVRLGIDSPCAKLGHCVSLEKTDHPAITDGCSAARRICASYLISARQQTAGRIKVILCGETLGY